MINAGAHPCQTMYLGGTSGATVAASAFGTAASTVLGTISATYARGFEVWNLTGLNLELVLGPDNGTSSIGIFCPGSTAAGTLAGTRAERNQVALQQGMQILVRTTVNVPATIAAASFVINFWA